MPSLETSHINVNIVGNRRELAYAEAIPKAWPDLATHLLLMALLRVWWTQRLGTCVCLKPMLWLLGLLSSCRGAMAGL